MIFKKRKKIKFLISKVKGHEGPCRPVWINKNQVCRRFDGGVTGFFKNVKLICGIYFKVGKKFHGIILNQNDFVTSTELEGE